MLNPVSYVYQYVKKKVTKRGVQLLSYLCLFVILFCVLIKWNTVSSINDTIIFETVRLGNFKEDSIKHAGINLHIKNPYFTHSTKGIETCVSISYWQNEYRDCLGLSRGDLCNYLDGDYVMSEKMNSIRSFFNEDVSVLYVIKARKELFKNAIAFVNTKNFNSELFYPNYSYKDSVMQELVYARGKAEFVDDVFGQELLYVFTNKKQKRRSIEVPVNAINKVDKGSSFLNYCAMYDISQSYYTLNIEGVDKFCALKDSVTLEIDFGGATSFVGLCPEPDKMTYSSVLYTNQNKIRHIMSNGGVRMYCQFMETSGVQSTRIYMLSTIATFLFGLFAKGLVETKFNIRKLKKNVKIIIKRIKRRWKKFFVNINIEDKNVV